MRRLLLLLVACAACGDRGGDAPPDAFPDSAPELPDAAVGDPDTLADTGLYSDAANQVLAPGVVEYAVAWELWADGASKRRFLLLPAGEMIDTSDMDYWSVPVGTKIWKEFAVGDTRVETRLIWKRGPALEDWFAVAFAWNAEGTEAVAVPLGQDDVLGTTHDIPRDNDCRRCHERQPDFALGVSAIQLDHGETGMNLAALVDAGALSDPPAGSPPYFPLPGDSTAQGALGYLHGNCGHCHNNAGALTGLDLLLAQQVDADAQSSGRTMQSLLGHSSRFRPQGSDSAQRVARDGGSHMLTLRMKTNNTLARMPPLGVQQVDAEGVALIERWINQHLSNH